ENHQSRVHDRAKLVYQYLKKGMEGEGFSPVPSDHTLKDNGGTFDSDMQQVYRAARILSGKYGGTCAHEIDAFESIMRTVFPSMDSRPLYATTSDYNNNNKNNTESQDEEETDAASPSQ